jgi:predicted neuraminidase
MAGFIFTEAPHPQCHASTIAATPTGLVAAWFGGTKEKHPDVGIWLSRFVAGHWTTPIEVANGVQYTRRDGSVHRHPCWNPVLFQPKEGPLLLFYKCGPEPSAWWGMLMTSADGGATWSDPRRLPEGILGPVKNKPVQLADGMIVCPSSSENDGWRLHLEITNDLGKTWARSGPLNDGIEKGAIQPSLLFHKDGRWQMLARDRKKAGNVWTTWSRDVGRTWSTLESAGLPNPSSGTDAVTLTDGRQLLVYNHAQRHTEDIGPSRRMLNVAVSDDGRTWQAALVLEDGDGEYSYPAVIQTNDELVHVTYTWDRKRIKHVVVDPAKLVLHPIVDGQWPRANHR